MQVILQSVAQEDLKLNVAEVWTVLEYKEKECTERILWYRTHVLRDDRQMNWILEQTFLKIA